MDLIRKGNDKKLGEVLEKTPEAGARQDSEGNSPVNFAIREGKVKCLEVLMKAGISGTDVDGTGKTPAEHLAPGPLCNRAYFVKRRS